MGKGSGGLTRGLVGGVHQYAVLPQITPAISLLLTIAAVTVFCFFATVFANFIAASDGKSSC